MVSSSCGVDALVLTKQEGAASRWGNPRSSYIGPSLSGDGRKLLFVRAWRWVSTNE
jgi:hypothetical protein